MKRISSFSFRLTLLILFLAALPAFPAANVFDMPSLHIRHIQLLALMNVSHRQKDYVTMEAASRQGLELGTADERWAYNLACAFALQGKTREALAALDQSIDAGFHDTRALAQDPDLDSLRGSEAFKMRVTRMSRLDGSRVAITNRIIALAPDATHTVMQTASNTLWSFQAGLFQTLIQLPQTNPPTAYAGPEADVINAWLRDGTASGAAGLLYENRDNDTQPLDMARYPGMTRLGYAQEICDRKLNVGLPNTLFTFADSSLFAPVIGHSSMGYLNSAYWRSQPRAVCGDPRQLALQSVTLLGNQLFFYPVYGDYDMQTGDLFPANTPYSIAVAGQNNAERPFVEAAAAALAALRPKTRAELTRTGLLMPTLSMLFRASQKTLNSKTDYLTGIAHPSVFQAKDLDTAKLVRLAHALTTNTIPPLVLFGVRSETQMIPDRDYFDLAHSEQLFDTPLAIARVFRGAAFTRTLEIQTYCSLPDTRLHWVVLRGDPAKIRFTPNPTNATLMSLTVAYHAPFKTPIGNQQEILSSRVDIGVIAETGDLFSLPSIISFYFPGNERRLYSSDGKIRSIDYTQTPGGYTDPLLCATRRWKDVYQYDEKGNMTGWRRIRSGRPDDFFTAFGHLIATRDSRGRALKAHVISYLPRRIKTNETDADIPDLAQADDNMEVAYRYASDADFVGRPDGSSLTQGLQPPDPAVSP